VWKVDGNMRETNQYARQLSRSQIEAGMPPIIHEPGSVKTEYDRDPFHYSTDEMRILAEDAGLSVRVIGHRNHPRAQQMLVFSR
jgi:hypothetical protein